MTMKRKYILIAGSLFALLVIELTIYGGVYWVKINQLTGKYDHQILMERLNLEKKRISLLDEFERSKFAATGKDAFKRIYNTKRRDLPELIEKLALESFPRGWKIDVRVEEFTKTLLLVRPEGGPRQPRWRNIKKSLLPVLRHSGKYLENVAVYNEKQQCWLFLDEKLLHKLRIGSPLRKEELFKARRKGKSFTRYNATKIPFKERGGHIYLDVIISGTRDSKKLEMMLDTGASMTVISNKVAMQTGRENLIEMPQRTFSTVKGDLTVAIVERQVILGNVEQKSSVAVTQQEGISLLGVNFFESKEYIIDTSSKSIYIWAK